jgi:outer membrane protein assembly factor BamA
MHNLCTQWIGKTALVFILCLPLLPLNAQDNASKKNYPLSILITDKDSSFNLQALKFQTSFNSQAQAVDYTARLPQLLASKGYPLASIDSSWATDTALYIHLYLGTKFNWVQLSTAGIERKALEQSGYISKNYPGKPVNLLQLQGLEQRLLNYYENEGYPFAAVYLDSVQIDTSSISASMKVDKGILYHIDSIRIVGKAKMNNYFLQRHLGIANGSVYNKGKLKEVDKRMLELPFLSSLQPSDLTMLGTGAVLNLYLQPKKSSQVNFLVGFLPSANDTKKLQLTGDVNLDLKNLLGGGEGILLKWQQLQPKSPRLNLGYNQPYIFRSPFGFDLLFDLFKKDSSFLQVNAQVGLQYVLSATQTGKLFVQWQSNSLLEGAIDTSVIKAEKKLPPNIDVNSTNVGLNYEWNKTNYRFNPRYGNEVSLITSIGIKNVKRSNDILNISDPGFNYASLYDSIKLRSYQLRARLAAAHYFPMGKASTLKMAAHTGFYNSPAIFRNELFQIGGYKLLRGFDEESIYATRYAVATAEFRLLVSLNSYLFFFTDAGLTRNKYQNVDVKNNFISAGVGILYEAKFGLLNLSYAMGRRDDVKFNIREASKLHFGYINYF